MTAIPRRIFQTWETADVPARWAAAQASVIEQNPTACYRLLTDADRYALLEEHFPQLVPVMRAFPYAVQRADLARYVLMYVHGGVYLDLDYVCLRPLPFHLPPESDVGLVWSTNLPGHVSNSFLMSRPRAHFWLEVIAAACRPAPRWAITRHTIVFTTTGPRMLNRVRTAYRAPQRIHVLEGIVVPCNVCEIPRCTAAARGFYLLPIAGNSWHAWDSTLLNWLYCHACAVTVAALVLVAVILTHRTLKRNNGTACTRPA